MIAVNFSAIAQVRAALDDFGAKKPVVIRAVALELFSRVVRRSPVDTGFYRASHDLTLGAPSSFVATPGGGPRTNLVPSILQGVPAQGPFPPIFISNNAPYARRLEFGHSRQAPVGVYRVTAAEFPAIVARASKVFGAG